MTNILDTVEPDARVVVPLELGSPDSPFPELRFANGSHTRLDDGDTLYSREAVESIIEAVKAENRKQVLLEAGEKFEFSVRAELRRMAEGEKE
jgi:hypothetical protein